MLVGERGRGWLNDGEEEALRQICFRMVQGMLSPLLFQLPRNFIEFERRSTNLIPNVDEGRG